MIDAFTDNFFRLDKQFHLEIDHLATYEIFHEEINRFCSPPASGDIYEIDGQLYMLAGQECDLVVRSNGATVSRNEKLAELVKCNFKHSHQDAKVDSSNISSVTVNHFKLDGHKGTLEITLGDREFFDFRLLDLCCLSENGKSRFAEDNFPGQTILKLLPEKWSKYVPHLISELKDRLKVQQFIADEGINPSTLTGDYSFYIDYQEEDGLINFPVRRIASIKGQFREYVMQRYWQYKTRKGLNTIGLYQRNLVRIHSLQAGYPYNLQEVGGDHHAWLQLTGNRDKNRNKSKLSLVLKKEEIATTLGGDFEHAINEIQSGEIIIATDDFKENRIVFSKAWEEDNLSLKIKFPLFNEYAGHYFEGRDGLTIYDLFGKDLVKSSPNIRGALFVHETVPYSLFVEGGVPHRIDLNQLIAGEIHIPAENIRLEFDQENGKFHNAGVINIDANEEE